MSQHRAIIKINEELCNGCGACLPSCAEGALRIEGGKLRLIADKLCDVLGACLGSCPRGALSIEQREADPFEKPASAHACPSEQPVSAPAQAPRAVSSGTGQSNWPIKLALVPAAAPFLHGAEIFLTADCAPGACTDFHSHFQHSGPLLLCCPKLEQRAEMIQRLAALIRESAPAAFVVVRMEVPCCGIPEVLAAARKEAGSNVPVRVTVLDRFGQEVSPLNGPSLKPLR